MYIENKTRKSRGWILEKLISIGKMPKCNLYRRFCWWWGWGIF
jgi:hypothetical protein